MFVCKSPVLKLVGCWFEFHKKGVWFIICPSVLQDYFNVPDEARRVQFFGYLKPGKNRVKVSWAKSDTRGHLKGSILFDGQWEFLVGETREFIEALLEKHGTLYVECEYE